MLAHHIRLLARRSTRGAALLTTVLVAAIGASIVLALATLASADLRTSAASQDVASARDATQAVLANYQATLRSNPTAFLSSVDQNERARVCVNDPARPVVQPGSQWPATCGASWTYTDPTASLSASLPARIEVTPPSPGSSQMTVRAVGKKNSAQAAASMTLVQSSAAAWTAMTDGSLDTSSLTWSASLPDASASFYSGATLTVPSSWAPQSALLAGETAVAGATPSDKVQVFTASPTQSQGNIRDVTPAVLRSAALGASAEQARQVACAGLGQSTPTNATGSPSTVSQLCLRRNARLTTIANTQVSVPSSTLLYLVVPVSDAGRAALRVYVSSKNPSVDLTGNLYQNAAASLAAGTHPGGLSFWSELGVFFPPASGVVAADGDVHLGLCGSGFQDGTGCATWAGSSQAGAQVSAAVTVIAGSSSAPRDVYLAGPVRRVSGSDARLGAVAFGDVVIPYWSHTATGGLQFDANLVALGNGAAAFGAVRSGAIHTLPDGRPTQTAAAGRLSLNGSVAAPSIALSASAASQFSSVQLGSDPGAQLYPPPYFPTFNAGWEPVTLTQVAPASVCPSSTLSTCPDAFFSTSSSSPNVTTPYVAPTSPATPTGLGLSVANAALGVSWTRDVVSANLTSYNVFTTDVATGVVATQTVSASTCTTGVTCATTVSGLTNGKRYSVTVSATNSSGVESARSGSQTAIPNQLPGAPSGLRASVAQGNQVDLTWTPPSGPVDGYVIYRSGAEVARSSFAYWSDGSVTSGTTYSYTVAAYNSAGTGSQSSSVSATPQNIPSAPSTVSVTPNSGALSLTVTWNTPASTYTGFRVYYNTSNNFATASALSDLGTVFTTTLTNLTGGQTYFVWVQTLTAQTTSIPSAVASATVVPATVTGLAMSSRTATSISLTWNASSQTTVGYNIYRAASNSFPGASGLVQTSTTTSATVSSLVADTTYFWWVLAVDAPGLLSPTPSSLSATTTAAPPTGLSQSGSTTTSVTVTFTPPGGVGSVSTYQYSTDGTNYCTLGATASPLTVSTFTNAACTGTALSASNTYTLYVRTVNANAAGAPSTVASLSVTTSPPALSRPAAASPSVSQLDALEVTWTAPALSAGQTGTVSAVSSYQVSGGGTCSANAPTASCVVTGLTSKIGGSEKPTSYTFLVRATNAGGRTSSASPTSTAMTPDGYNSYAFTGAVATWDTPDGISTVKLELAGARGGAGTPLTGFGTAGARGAGHAYKWTNVSVSGSYSICVGGVGGTGTNGGPGGYNGGSAGSGYAGGGGGATDFRATATGCTTAGTRYYVAPGGGGGGAVIWNNGAGGAGGGVTTKGGFARCDTGTSGTVVGLGDGGNAGVVGASSSFTGWWTGSTCEAGRLFISGSAWSGSNGAGGNTYSGGTPGTWGGGGGGGFGAGGGGAGLWTAAGGSFYGGGGGGGGGAASSGGTAISTNSSNGFAVVCWGAAALTYCD